MTTPARALAVCGPTASGKSDLSIALARALNAEIVNVDSVQVYRELDIGSAKLPSEERGGVPHHALDIFAPDHSANVAEFRHSALASIRDIEKRGKLPILVGGSGMYMTVLLHGLAEVPSTPEDLRRAVAEVPIEALYAELEQLDPETARRLNPRDRQRVSRAVEICRMTGNRPSELLARHTFASVDVVSLVIVLCRPRDELYQRINHRAEKMITDGLLQETDEIVRRYGRVPPLETLGYKQACEVLAGTLPESRLAEEIALHTRRFAKRQMTYWRNEPRKRGWIVRPLETERAEDVAGFNEFPARARKHMKSFRAFCFTTKELIAAVSDRLTSSLPQTEVWYVRLVDESR